MEGQEREEAIQKQLQMLRDNIRQLNEEAIKNQKKIVESEELRQDLTNELESAMRKVAETSIALEQYGRKLTEQDQEFNLINEKMKWEAEQKQQLFDREKQLVDELNKLKEIAQNSQKVVEQTQNQLNDLRDEIQTERHSQDILKEVNKAQQQLIEQAKLQQAILQEVKTHNQ